MDNKEYLTCLCYNCSGQIEFPAQGIGEVIECPHCKLETTLYKMVTTRHAPTDTKDGLDQTIPRPHCIKPTIFRGKEGKGENWGAILNQRLLVLGVISLLGLVFLSWFLVLKPRAEAKAARKTFIEAFRNDLVSLEVAIEKGIAQAEFTQRSRQLVAQARAHSGIWTTKQKTTLDLLELYFDGLIHFWPKYIQNQWCVRAEAEDRVWITRLGLSNDTNVWSAYDFRGAMDAFSADARNRAESAIEMAELHRLGSGLGGMAASHVRKASLDRQIEFGEQQLANADNLLAEAARRKRDFSPSWVMDRLIKFTSAEIEVLNKLLQRENGLSP